MPRFRWSRVTPQKPSLVSTLLAGILGGFALNAAIALTFGLIGYGSQGQGILISSSIQSEKLVAVWTEIEPIPLIVSNPARIVAGLIGFAIGHALVYRWIWTVMPDGLLATAWRLAVLVFFMSFAFFEFFGPFNQFGEPVPLLALELLFWLVVALAEGFVIVAVVERLSAADTAAPSG